MTITKIYIHKPTKDNYFNKNLLADVDIVIDYDIVINGIKLMKGNKGKYLKFPYDYKGRNIAFPINNEIRQYILEKILQAYSEEDINE